MGLEALPGLPLRIPHLLLESLRSRVTACIIGETPFNMPWRWVTLIERSFLVGCIGYSDKLPGSLVKKRNLVQKQALLVETLRFKGV